MNQNDFVHHFVNFTKEFESPTSFWKWSAYSAIAATLRYSCNLKWGTSYLYPNIYTLLLADSARFRKDAGPVLVGELLRECSHTKVILGRSSWQGIVDELSQDIGNKKTGVPIKGGGGIIIAKEFTAAFVEDNSLIQMMTEGYAYEEEFDYTLRGGKTKIKNRCISLLAGSNETLLRDMYNAKAIYGGLLRRTFLIKPDKPRPPNSYDDDATNHIPLANRKILVDTLNRIKNLKGEFTRDLEARRAFKTWYEDLYNNYEKYEDRTGFIAGVHALVMKLAMILAANEESMIITEKIISQAIKEVLALKENYTSYTLGTGKNPHANIGGLLLTDLWILCNVVNGKVHTMKRRDILLKYWNEISSEDLDKLITTLEGANLIHMVPSGNEPSYGLTQKAKDAFLKNIQSKSAGVN